MTTTPQTHIITKNADIIMLEETNAKQLNNSI
jgi:hypothetical protein